MTNTPLQARELIEWLVEAFGYPHDLNSSVPPPKWAVPIIADVWYRRENFDANGNVIHADVIFAAYEASIRDEIERIQGVVR